MTKPKIETHQYEAETGKILDIVINSLYENKDTFLRELISNASDANDKLKYESLTEKDLISDNHEFKISIKANEDDNSIIIRDFGIGMSKKELIENLGTIAKSGTEKFMKAFEKNKDQAMQLIGQFGVGFYSAFMVADKVTVTSKKAGSKKSYIWQSTADHKFTIEEGATNFTAGTEIKLHLKENCTEFLDKHRVSFIVKTYSDHISYPIEYSDKENEAEVINSASALWTKAPAKVKKEEYQEFYKHTAHAVDEPWMILHNKAEGVIEYTNLLFIPSTKPFDLFHPDRKTRVKLYVKRVFISEENVDILPKYLRFVQGIVDSEDLPLNISRETLQHNNVLAKIKKALTKKILNELKKKSQKQPEEFKLFWENFGGTLKEGLCEMGDENSELLLDICHFKTTKSGDKFITLEEYVKNMQPNQKNIFFASGDNLEELKKNPKLEGFLKRDIEVVLLTDSVDDFWINTTNKFKDTELTSITRSGIELDEIKDLSENKDKKDKDETSKKDEEDIQKTIDFIKNTLGTKVADVKISKTLSESPVCLTVTDGAMDMRMERFLIAQKQLAGPSPKILEVNPKHTILKYLSKNLESNNATDLANLLFDQARILEGETINDTSDFIKRFNSVLEQAVAA